MHTDPHTPLAVSVVIPALNAGKTLPTCLQSLTNQTFTGTYEIIVVDDGSSDDTLEVARTFDVKVIRQDRGGPAAARNRGASEATGNILLFTDSDCEPVAEWMEEMLKPLENPDITAVKGAYLTRQKEVMARYIQFDREERYRRVDAYPYVDSLFTNAAAVRRDTFMKLGGFDTTLMVHEDSEFSYRLRRNGYFICFNPKATIYHTHPTTWKKFIRVQFFRAYWKAEVHSEYRSEAVSDSHVPQVLKIQILLIGMMGLGVLLGFLWSPLWSIAALGFLLLILSSLPSAIRGVSHGADVALIALVAQPCRAVTHAAGVGFWVIKHMRKEVRSKPIGP